MARAALQKVYADFREGFVTVANPLAYPEGTLKDIVNFDINDNGTLSIRPGLRQDSLTTITTSETMASVNDKAVSVHIWNNVNNIGGAEIAVVQVGKFLYLFNMLDDGIDLDNLLDTIELPISAEGQTESISAAPGNGKLFISHSDVQPRYIEKTDTGFDVTIIRMEIRDTTLWRGANDNQTGFTSATVYAQHAYNLLNGGWPKNAPVISVDQNPDDGTYGPLPTNVVTKASINKYPSIAIPFSSAKAGGGNTTNEQIAYSPWRIENDYFGNSFVPLGHFIKNVGVWSRTGDGETAFPGTTKSNATVSYFIQGWPTSIEFYAGRVWYAGARGYTENRSDTFVASDPIDISNTIYFSQQLDSSLSKVGRCYQENDPTAEDINQLLATDGGTISIQGMGKVQDIKTFGTSLIIFASEGIWSISGTDINSFSATDFSINKISNIGPLAKNAILADGNNIYYLTNDALYVLTTNEVTGLPVPQDVTSSKIKDFYTGIPFREKIRAKVLFDKAHRNLFMFYSEQNLGDTDFTNIFYNRCLVFNQDLKSFYKYEIPIVDRYIVDGLFYNKDTTVTAQEVVTVGGVPVTVGGEAVTLDDTFSTAALNNIQLLTIVDNAGNAEFTFSSFTDIINFQDWGEDYTAFVETGFDTAGDIMRDSLKAPVLISHMERTEDGYEDDPDDPGSLILTNGSSCLLSYGWDWATNYKNQREIYRFNRNYIPEDINDPFNYGVDIITTRNRIRGKGHSLGIRLEAGSGKNCIVLGLGILYTVAREI